MNVLILAGGKGTRLRPYTTVLPKPLLPLVDKPILEYLLNQLKKCGLTNIYMSVGYLSSLIQAYFGDGRKFGVNIQYLTETTPLGTAGPLALIPQKDVPTLVLNGDLITDLDFNEIIRFHEANHSILTIGVQSFEYQLPLGFLKMDQESKVQDYIEKPTKYYDVSMGIYVCGPEVFSHVAENEKLDFPDLTKNLIDAGLKVSGYKSESLWIDVGKPAEYERATQLIKEEGLFQ